MKVFIFLLLLTWSVALPSKVDLRLRTSLKINRSANIFVSFYTGTSTIIKSLSTKTYTSRSEKVSRVKTFLQRNTDITQAQVRNFLKTNHRQPIRSFWISNQIYIKNASSNLINALANFAEVSQISEEPIFTLNTLTSSSTVTTSDDIPTWGLDKIRAPDVWSMSGGNRGEGIVVGGIDSGVLGTHETLRGNFLGEYGWFDPEGIADEPFDDNGHGTHTMATIVGSHGVGVAPGAKWMACRGCRGNRCRGSDLLACGEFMTCPTLPNGTGQDCSKAPQIVSNSWGGAAEGFFNYSAVIDAWLAIGIVPVFAAGNRALIDPVCGGVNYPADYPYAIAVGNTDIEDRLALTSDQGPSAEGYIKPDVSAPGKRVKSAYIPHFNSYRELTGTSMACPHVAGVAALLLSNSPNLKPHEVRGYLIFGSEQDNLKKRRHNCGGISENNFPNNAFGYGRISAYNSFLKLINDPLTEFPGPTKSLGGTSQFNLTHSLFATLFIYCSKNNFL